MQCIVPQLETAGQLDVDQDSLAQHPQPVPDRVSQRPLQFWGLSAQELHDRCWASFGFQVIRRHGADVQRRGPQFYLLVDTEDLVFFNPKAIVDQFNWLKPTAMRLRVTDSRGEGYSESIEANTDGRLEAVHRGYSKKTRQTLRVWITPDADVASTWQNAQSCRQGWKALAEQANPDQVLAIGRPGRIFDAASPQDVDDCLLLLQKHWQDLGSVIDGVYEFVPGVWLHESVTVPKGVRFVGDVWLGAEHSLKMNEILVGPGGRPDSQDTATSVRPIPWEEIKGSSWRRMRRRGNHRSRSQRISKRLFDIAFASAAILATLPLYPFIIAMIVIEDGWPPFFAHYRQTVNGKEFPCWKFRTMRKDAEDMKAQLQEANQADGPQFFMEHDPRLLRCGDFLRKMQFDELPQFWNVLLGHMSVVGPRPSPEKENQFCPTWREARLSVRPGVTGLWQVRRTRQPQTDFQEWIQYDLEYVQRQDWRLDMWIIWQTVKRIFKA